MGGGWPVLQNYRADPAKVINNAIFNDNVASSISNNTGTNAFNNAGTFATNFSSGTTTEAKNTSKAKGHKPSWKSSSTPHRIL